MNQRLFVAIELPEPVRLELRDLQPAAAGVRPTKAENLHLTLHFIGDASPEPLCEALAPISNAVSPFSLELAGVGRFTARGANVIFWVGVRMTPELLKLHTDVGRLLGEAGVAIETRPYSPHITIARGQRVRHDDIAEFLVLHQDYSAVVSVESVVLMSSSLQPGGPAYAVEHRFSFERK